MAGDLASSSSSYQVFLSFRGTDTRRIFIDYLHDSLEKEGICTFMDEEDLPRGENIRAELRKEIRDSKISVIVFSKDYASSTWCLDELVKILECQKKYGQIIFPIFYHIDPSEVRKQTGSFTEAFATHVERLGEGGISKIDSWKQAVKEVADMAGEVLKDEHELKFIKKVVKDISKKLNRTILNMPKFLVGIDHHLEKINCWLQEGSMNAGIMTICGLGGIGKTTIAKAIYNQNFDRFECSSFLANIRERSAEPNGLVCLQQQLLSDISRGTEINISCVDKGLVKIKNALSCKQFLIILDDVDHIDQLNTLLIMQSSFDLRSKIIITTRNEKLLKAHEKYEMTKINGLTFDDSSQLFCCHAFGQDHPPESYKEHTKRVVHYCGGVPLALEVLGASLSGRSRDYWESKLKKLEVIREKDILEKLAVSYDSLQDDHDKNLFLDIACFFVGKHKDDVITILDECDFYTGVGIENLKDRSLVKISVYNNTLTMHQLLRDMAREIVRQESPKEPGKRSRLWDPKDVFDVLKDYTGTETIEGLNLNLHKSEDKGVETFFNPSKSKCHWSESSVDQSTMLHQMSSLKRRCLGFLSWLPINVPSTKFICKSDDVGLQTAAFSRMRRLRLLELNNVSSITGGFDKFPKKVRWLSWHAFPLKSIPSDFSLERLVVLDMRYSHLVHAWKGTQPLKCLKVLDLSHSCRLTHTPDFSRVPNLERLILEGCVSLVEVHESIGRLERLVVLNLEGCTKLGKLPETMGELKSLKKLDLSGINQLPSASGKVLLPALPRFLTELRLRNCNISDVLLPKDLSSLSSLCVLDLSHNPICGLPVSIKGLKMLEWLDLHDCTSLQSLPELPRHLRHLPQRRRLSVWTWGVHADGCGKLVEIQGLFKLEPIGHFDVEILNSMGLAGLKSTDSRMVKLYNIKTRATNYYTPQVLHYDGVFSIFLPGIKIERWFSEYNYRFSVKMKPGCRCAFVGFKVPSFGNVKIEGLNVLCSRSRGILSRVLNEALPPYIEITNVTKDIGWDYRPIFSLDLERDDGMWLSHWKIGNQLDVGDVVAVSVWEPSSMHLGDFEVHLVCRSEEKGTQSSKHHAHRNVVHGSIPSYPSYEHVKLDLISQSD